MTIRAHAVTLLSPVPAASQQPAAASRHISPMTTVGLVGGPGPESTIDYYRRILAGWEHVDPTSMPSIVIDSLDVNVGLKLAAGDHAGLNDYLLKSIRRLEGAGCDFVAMTANTAHLVFDELA